MVTVGSVDLESRLSRPCHRSGQTSTRQQHVERDVGEHVPLEAFCRHPEVLRMPLFEGARELRVCPQALRARVARDGW